MGLLRAIFCRALQVRGPTSTLIPASVCIVKTPFPYKMESLRITGFGPHLNIHMARVFFCSASWFWARKEHSFHSPKPFHSISLKKKKKKKKEKEEKETHIYTYIDICKNNCPFLSGFHRASTAHCQHLGFGVEMPALLMEEPAQPQVLPRIWDYLLEVSFEGILLLLSSASRWSVALSCKNKMTPALLYMGNNHVNGYRTQRAWTEGVQVEFKFNLNNIFIPGWNPLLGSVSSGIFGSLCARGHTGHFLAGTPRGGEEAGPCKTRAPWGAAQPFPTSNYPSNLGRGVKSLAGNILLIYLFKKGFFRRLDMEGHCSVIVWHSKIHTGTSSKSKWYFPAQDISGWCEDWEGSGYKCSADTMHILCSRELVLPDKKEHIACCFYPHCWPL